jgi:hypothetical protein
MRGMGAMCARMSRWSEYLMTRRWAQYVLETIIGREKASVRISEEIADLSRCARMAEHA